MSKEAEILRIYFFGVEIDDGFMTINQSLYILNSNNYSSLKNINFFSYLDKSYNFYLHKKRDFSDCSKFSQELVILLKSLKVNEEDMKKEDINILKNLEILDFNNLRKKKRSNDSNGKNRCPPPKSSGKLYYS